VKHQAADADASASYFAARTVVGRIGVHLFRHLREQLGVAILLATFGCLPARCQDAGHFAIRQAAKVPAPRLIGGFCFLPRTELCSALISADPQNAPGRSSDGAFKKTIRRFGKDQAEIYSAPFHRSNLKWDALFLAGTGVFIATDRQASRALPGNHFDISRNISTAGLYGTSAAAGVLWLSGLATHNEHAREAGTLSAEALANTVPVYAGLQLITGRERPIEGSGNGRFWRNNALNSSFPSGHALFTWSMASVIAHEYPRPWVKWLVYGTATAVSVTRFTGREHFPSDMVVGSALGYLIGRHIFQVHCKEGLSEACHSRKIDVADRP
jgi:membrane-associated phospholipid phosphatase